MKLKHTQAIDPLGSCGGRLAAILATHANVDVNNLELRGNGLAAILANHDIIDVKNLKSGDNQSTFITISPANGYVKDVVAAAFLGCSVSRLRSDRFRCRGLPYYRFGRSILYKISDLEAYLEETKVVPVEIF